MGAGKTTVGYQLSDQLGYSFLDTDHEIEKQVGLSIPEIFESYGENYFRELETQVLKEIPLDNYVIGTGGGIVEKEENRALLKEHNNTVYLKVDYDTILKRLVNDDSRPLWKQTDHERLTLFNRRQAYYEESSSLTIQTDALTREEVSNQILKYI